MRNRKKMKQAAALLLLGAILSTYAVPAFADGEGASPSTVQTQPAPVEKESTPPAPATGEGTPAVPEEKVGEENGSSATAETLPNTEEKAAPGGDALSSNLVITGYKVLKGSKQVSRVEKGDRVNIQVTLKNTGLTTDQVGSVAGLDVTKPVDSFSFRSGPKVQITSQGKEPLALTLTFENGTYSGTGKDLRFIVAYPNLSLPYDSKELTVLECKESGPSSPREENGAGPILRVSREEITTPVKAGDKISLKVTFKNYSENDNLENIVASFTPSDGLMLLGSTSTRIIGDLDSKKSASVTLELQALDEIPSASQHLTVEMRYDFLSSNGRVPSTASDRILIPAVAKSRRSEIATPNLIVNQYSYGNQVAAGSSFDLKLAFRNTSTQIPVENIVLSLDTGDGLSIQSSSNTFYFPAVGAGESREITVKMKALTNTKADASSSPKVSLNFKYEFVDVDKRNQATASEVIAIPVYQPDRFQVTAPTLAAPARQNEEYTVTLPYVNKGKVDVYNVEAQLQGDIESLSTQQNYGNFEPGKSGTIDFIVTPRKEGEQKFTVRVLYENSDQEQKELLFPVTLNVAAAASGPTPSEGEGELTQEGGTGKPLLLIVPAALVVLAGGGLLLRRRKKKAQAAPVSAEYNWQEDELNFDLPAQLGAPGDNADREEGSHDPQ